MKLADVIREECIEVGSTPTSKDAVLRRAAELAIRHPALAACRVETVYQSLKEREAMGSTGFGKGVAIPHCRLKEAPQFVAGVITIPRGIDFESADGEPVRLVVFMIAPLEHSSMHIRLLSEISQVLRTPGAPDKILRAKSAGEAKRVLLAHGRAELVSKSGDRKLLLVIVQDEGIFHELLEVVAGVDPSSVAAIDARTAEEHLAHVPLFSGLWDGRRPEACKILVALVAKDLINETIRRVEHVTGRLDERSGVVVIVHEPFYVAGRLTD